MIFFQKWRSSAAAFLFAFLFVFTNLHAAEKIFLTVDELVKNGYSQLTEAKLRNLLKQHKIEVRDIETDAVSISTRTKTEVGNNRKSESIKNDKPMFFLDTRLLARAPLLQGEPDYQVSGDKLIATDGLRTYMIRFYEKQDKIFGVRDIDNGNVFFEIILK